MKTCDILFLVIPSVFVKSTKHFLFRAVFRDGPEILSKVTMKQGFCCTFKIIKMEANEFYIKTHTSVTLLMCSHLLLQQVLK